MAMKIDWKQEKKMPTFNIDERHEQKCLECGLVLGDIVVDHSKPQENIVKITCICGDTLFEFESECASKFLPKENIIPEINVNKTDKFNVEIQCRRK
jgi:hypothetical protein